MWGNDLPYQETEYDHSDYDVPEWIVGSLPYMESIVSERGMTFEWTMDAWRTTAYQTCHDYIDDKVDELDNSRLNQWIQFYHGSDELLDDETGALAGLFVSAAVEQIEQDYIELCDVRPFHYIGYRNTTDIRINGSVGKYAIMEQDGGSMVVKDHAKRGFANRINDGLGVVKGHTYTEIAKDGQGGNIHIAKFVGNAGENNDGTIIKIDHLLDPGRTNDRAMSTPELGSGMAEGAITVHSIESSDQRTIRAGTDMEGGIIKVYDSIDAVGSLQGGTIAVDGDIEYVGDRQTKIPVTGGTVFALGQVSNEYVKDNGHLVIGELEQGQGPLYALAGDNHSIDELFLDPTR